jgi:23S rRNA pseudouridine1911/1915/1917 synthase
MLVPTDPPRVLLEDGPLLAVAKPAGLPTQAPAPNPSLEAWVKDHLRAKYDKPGNVYLGIPHRLDRPVSGIVIFAKNSKAAARLAEEFRDRVVRKIYWAVLTGRPSPGAGEWTDWLRKIPDEPRGEVVPEGTPDAKLAQLKYRVIGDIGGDKTLVEIELLTGRMHQIRLQAASRSVPVVGDELYGGPKLGDFAEPRILLHARTLELKHPVRYDTLRIECPPPDWWPQLPDAQST